MRHRLSFRHFITHYRIRRHRHQFIFSLPQ
jgi:hypothetical protein